MADSTNKNIEKQEITLKELFFLIKNNAKKLYIFASICIFICVVYLLTIRSSYSVSGTILIKDQAAVFNPLEGMGSNLNYLENEMIILKSRSTADSTIRTLLKSEHKNSLHLFDTQKYSDPPLRNFFRIIYH